MKNIIIILLISVLFYSCQNNSSKEKVLAKVGNTQITEKYLEEKINEITQDPESYLSSKPGKKQFLDMLINEKLVKFSADNSPIKNSKEYKNQIALMKKELDLKLSDYKEYLLTKMWLEDLKNKDLKISEEEIKSYNDKYPKIITVEHVIADNPQTAEEILKRIKQGTSISKIMGDKKYSGKITGGQLPPVMAGEFLPELEDMVTKMKVGEVQGVVNSKLGFHVIKKLSEKQADLKNPEIYERIKRIIEKKKFDDYLLNVQKKYKVEVIDENYK